MRIIRKTAAVIITASTLAVSGLSLAALAAGSATSVASGGPAPSATVYEY
jgi:hypothetical protein